MGRGRLGLSRGWNNLRNTTVLPRVLQWGTMKIGVSIPEDLIAFADDEASRRGLSRSGLLATLLEAEKVRGQTLRYIDQYGWDVTEDEAAWRAHQKRRMAEAYGDDEW